MAKKKKVQSILENIDNYEQSLNACLCFIHIYLWDEERSLIDDSVDYYIGKEFKDKNNEKVTPDINIECNDELGLIIEHKNSFPREQEKWRGTFEQIKNYDQELNGWEKKKKNFPHNLILLTDQKFSKKVKKYIEDNSIDFCVYSKYFCLIQYSPAGGVKPAYFLRKEFGTIENFKTISNNRWDLEGFVIDLNYLINSGLISIKFLDYKPPIVYLMTILWDHIFPTLITEDKWRSLKGRNPNKQIKVEIEIDQVKRILVENYCCKDCQNIIKKKWIREAMENFIRIKFAKRNNNNQDNFIIFYKKQIKCKDGDENKNRYFAELLNTSTLESEDQKLITEFY